MPMSMPTVWSAANTVSAWRRLARLAPTHPAAILGVVALAMAANAAAAPPASAPATASRPAQNQPATGGVHKAGEFVIEPASLVVSATEKIEYELGTLYVPENRAEPNSRVIGVGFARFKSTTPTQAPPVFLLPGGPGMSFMASLKGMSAHLLRYRAVGDVVLVDQRGCSERGDVLKYGYPVPEEPPDQPASLARGTPAFVQVSRDAAAQLAKKGIDLRGYTVKECAEDLSDLRKALGYEKISLVGVSFGSQWSFATMRLHPEIVARALLSGVEPLDFGYDMPSHVLAAMQRYWRAAEQDKALQPYLPPGGLEAAAKAILQRLERGPVKVAVKDPKGGPATVVTLGKEDFQRDFVHRAADGPAFVLALYHGHYEAWAASVLAGRRPRQNELRLVGPLIDTSLGVTPGRERQLRSDPATAFLGQWNWDGYIASADIWPSADVGDDFRTPVVTPISVIFAQGDWDTQTPLENTLMIAKRFPKGRVVIAEHGGHGVLEPIAARFPKVWGQMTDFLRTGTMPDLPERLTLPLPKFAVPDFPAPTSAPASAPAEDAKGTRTGIAAQASQPKEARMKPVSLHPQNPHYFLFRDKPTVLIGSTEHYGAVLNADFDYVKYLDQLKADGLNLTRTFTGVYCEPPGAFTIAGNTLVPAQGKLLCPFARSDTPGFAGGGNKFDLTRWDDAYFCRLKEFVARAGRHGIVVELTLFCPFYEDSMWDISPFKAGNNVNGIGNVPRTEVYTLKHKDLLAVQEAVAKKIVGELKDADNLYYEICNEPYFGGVSLEWQHSLADVIAAAEKDFPARHMIAQNIANEKAKIEKPHPAVSLFNFHYASPPDTVGMNYLLEKALGDDETGFKGQDDATYRREGWEFILAGGALYDHLDYSFAVDHPEGAFKYPPKQPGGGSPALRAQLRILKEFMESLDFVQMKPDSSPVKGVQPAEAAYRLLAKPGQAYALYLRGGTQANVRLDLPAGQYKAEWVSTLTGRIDKAEQVTHAGGEVTLSSPGYDQDIAVRIIRMGR